MRLASTLAYSKKKLLSQPSTCCRPHACASVVVLPVCFRDPTPKSNLFRKFERLEQGSVAILIFLGRTFPWKQRQALTRLLSYLDDIGVISELRILLWKVKTKTPPPYVKPMPVFFFIIANSLIGPFFPTFLIIRPNSLL